MKEEAGSLQCLLLCRDRNLTGAELEEATRRLHRGIDGAWPGVRPEVA